MPNETHLALASILVLTGAAGIARADDAAEIPAQAQASYRLQILASDALAAGAFFGGDGMESLGGAAGTAGDALMAAGGVTYLLGGPVVHALHGNYGRGAISLGLRVLLPIVGANIGVALSGCDQHEQFANLCFVDDMAAGFLIGAATAAAADTLLVAPRSTATESAPRQNPPRLSLVPRIVATPDRALFGLSARF